MYKCINIYIYREISNTPPSSPEPPKNCVYIFAYVCIQSYIWRERKRERERE